MAYQWQSEASLRASQSPVGTGLMLRGGNTGKGRAWETRQSVACSLGPWKAVRLGLPAADNCLGRGFPAVLSRGAPPTMHGGSLGRAGVERVRRVVGGVA